MTRKLSHQERLRDIANKCAIHGAREDAAYLRKIADVLEKPAAEIAYAEISYPRLLQFVAIAGDEMLANKTPLFAIPEIEE